MDTYLKSARITKEAVNLTHNYVDRGRNLINHKVVVR